MAADEYCFDVFFVEAFELFCDEGSCRISGKDSVVKVSADQENIGFVVEGEVG